MIYHKHTLHLLLTAILILSSCRSTRIVPDTPSTGVFPERPARQLSQLSIPLEIDISAVEALINQKLPRGRLASDNRRVGNTTRYSYEVLRNRAVSFTAAGNELIFKVPIDIKARGSYTACVGFWRDGRCCSTPNPFGSGCATPGVTATENGSASPKVDVELRVKLGIQEDYSIKAETYLKGVITGGTHLKIDLIGNLIRINIDIKDKLEKPLRKFVSDYQQEIDKKVAELVKQYDLKKEIAGYWEKIKQPVQMGDFWLDIKPEKVFFENLNASNGKLRLGVGFGTRLAVTAIKPAISDRPLPNLTLTQGTQGLFNIYLPASTTFDLLESKAKETVVGKKYEKDGVSLKLKGLEIKGIQLNNTSLLLVSANVKGKAKFKRFKGDLYFTAKPRIDDERKVIAVEDFKIEANTSSFLINNGLPFLVDEFYYDELKEQMKYSYQADHDKFLNLINDELQEVKIDQLVINAELQSLRLPGVYIDEKQLELLLIAKGMIKTRLEL